MGPNGHPFAPYAPGATPFGLPATPPAHFANYMAAMQAERGERSLPNAAGMAAVAAAAAAARLPQAAPYLSHPALGSYLPPSVYRPPLFPLPAFPHYNAGAAASFQTLLAGLSAQQHQQQARPKLELPDYQALLNGLSAVPAEEARRASVTSNGSSSGGCGAAATEEDRLEISIVKDGVKKSVLNAKDSESDSNDSKSQLESIAALKLRAIEHSESIKKEEQEEEAEKDK